MIDGEICMAQYSVRWSDFISIVMLCSSSKCPVEQEHLAPAYMRTSRG